MKQFFSVVVFSLLVIGFFAGYSNFGIPQIEPAPPPKQEKLDLGAMTMEQFVVLGEKILNGKGTCKLCHNELGRAPMLDRLGANVPKRLKDPEYAGEAKDFESYLHESMLKPSAYVVAGFGKKGTNDQESPMPDVSAGSIGMSEAETAAVIAYLQESNGADITVEIPTGAGDVEEQAEGEARPLLTTVEDIIAGIGAKRGKEYLRRALLAPNADIAKGFEPDNMPPDLGETMYAGELEMMVNHLASMK